MRMSEPRSVPAAESAVIRRHLMEHHEFEVNDRCLVGNPDDLYWMHEDVHDDEDEFQTHSRSEMDEVCL